MELPSEMLDEILCRVPVKHLLRCRSVSKGWCSLIDSTPFAKKHLKMALDCNSGALIFNGCGHFFLAEDFKTNFDGGDDAVSVEISDPLKTRISGADFVGAANGLVCVSKNKMGDIYIFNPSTRKWRKVPSPPTEFPRTSYMTATFLCGFGYDHLNDDYKVVKIAEWLQFRGKMAIVYSLKTNSWKWIQNVPDNNNHFFFQGRGMFANGALHWLAFDPRPKGSYILVGFDLCIQHFRKVPCPVIDWRSDNPMHVVSDGGTLGILNVYPNDRIDVWVMMTDSAAENSWSKALTAKYHGTHGYNRFVRPVYFSKSCQSVLLEVDGSELVWHDLERKTAKNVRVRGILDKFDPHVYFPSRGILDKFDPHVSFPSREILDKFDPNVYFPGQGIPPNCESHVYTPSLVQIKEDNPPQKPSQDKPKEKHQKRRDDYLSRGFKPTL